MCVGITVYLAEINYSVIVGPGKKCVGITVY
jgi:hypothetical protein